MIESELNSTRGKELQESEAVLTKEADFSIQGNGYYYLLAMAGNEPLSVMEVSRAANTMVNGAITFFAPDVSIGLQTLVKKGAIRRGELAEPRIKTTGWRRSRPDKYYYSLTPEGQEALVAETLAIHNLASQGIEAGLLERDIDELERTIPKHLTSYALSNRPSRPVFTTSQREYRVLIAVNDKPRTYAEIITEVSRLYGEKMPRDMKKFDAVLRHMVSNSLLKQQGDVYCITPLGQWHGYVDTEHLLHLVDQAVAREVVAEDVPDENVVNSVTANNDKAILDEVHIEQDDINDLYFAKEIREIKDQLLVLFAEQQTQRAITILPTVQWLGRICRDIYVPFQRPEDVSFIERSLHGREYSIEEIYGAYTAMQQLAIVFYPYAEKYAASLFGHFGKDAAIDAAKQRIDVLLLRRWKVVSNTPRALTESLRRFVTASLKYTWSDLQDDRKREQPLEYEDLEQRGSEYYSREVTSQLVYGKEPVSPAKQQRMGLRRTLSEYIGEVMRGHSASEIFAHIETLSPRSQLAMLIYMGLITDRFSPDHEYGSLTERSYVVDLMRGAQELVRGLNSPLTPRIDPELSLREIKERANRVVLFKIKDTLLTANSRRRIIAEAFQTISETDLETFGELRRQVFALASEHVNGILRYSKKDIAAILGVREYAVECEIAILAETFGFVKKGESKALNSS